MTVQQDSSVTQGYVRVCPCQTVPWIPTVPMMSDAIRGFVYLRFAAAMMNAPAVVRALRDGVSHHSSVIAIPIVHYRN